MISIYGMTLKKLEDYFISISEKKFKAVQVYEWLYKKRVRSFDEFKNVKKETLDQMKKDLITEVNNSEDSLKVEKGVKQFVGWLQSGKLEIRGYKERKTHSKLYIMQSF